MMVKDLHTHQPDSYSGWWTMLKLPLTIPDGLVGRNLAASLFKELGGLGRS